MQLPLGQSPSQNTPSPPPNPPPAAPISSRTYAHSSSHANDDPGSATTRSEAYNPNLATYFSGTATTVASGAATSRGWGQAFHARCNALPPLARHGHGLGRGRAIRSPGSSWDNALFVMSSPGLSAESPVIISLTPTPPPQQPSVPARTYASVGMQTHQVFLLSALSSPASQLPPIIQTTESDSSPSRPQGQALLANLVDDSDDDFPASILPLQLPGLNSSRSPGAAKLMTVNPRIRCNLTSPTISLRKRHSDADDANPDTSAFQTIQATCFLPLLPPLLYKSRRTSSIPPGLEHLLHIEHISAAARGDGADPPATSASTGDGAHPAIPPSALSTPSRLKKTPASKYSKRQPRPRKTPGPKKGKALVIEEPFNDDDMYMDDSDDAPRKPTAKPKKGKAKVIEAPFNDDDMYMDDSDDASHKPTAEPAVEENFEYLFKNDFFKCNVSTPRKKPAASRHHQKTVPIVPSLSLASTSVENTLNVKDAHSTASDFAPISSLAVVNNPLDTSEPVNAVL
ncbi:hypothetical protein NLJ89_g11247 [Agrocybe chaxingu]|uniref:Uncharacterized protein n=1 Tax=Agrocybe chaxingu TaxID=84603 RepID=A0A9W8MN69_9AGAR|nr:hypothetical protein NLJ89_g11247 [Agrocybe chaxingu]